MTDEALWLDGNAVAGLLQELFGSEMTRRAARLRRRAGSGPGRRAPRLPRRGDRAALPGLRRRGDADRDAARAPHRAAFR